MGLGLVFERRTKGLGIWVSFFTTLDPPATGGIRPCAGRSRGVSTRSQLGRVPHLLQIPAHWCCHFEIICFTIQACSFLEKKPILVIAKDKHTSHRKLANKYIRAITFSTIDKLSTPLVYSEYFDLCGANFGTVSLCLSTNTK